MPLSLETPLSLYSIPVVWYTAFYPMNAKFALIQKTIGYNNLSPRANTRRIEEDSKVPRDVVERVRRFEGAHLNGNEVLPLWVAAVLAGNIARIPQRTLNLVSASFIVLRALYNYVYVNQKTVSASWLRSALFFTGLGFPMYLLVKAGNILRTATA